MLDYWLHADHVDGIRNAFTSRPGERLSAVQAAWLGGLRPDKRLPASYRSEHFGRCVDRAIRALVEAGAVRRDGHVAGHEVWVAV